MVKRITIVAACLALTACGMTPTQKRWTTVGVSVVATGLLIAHQQDNGADLSSSRGGKGGPFHPCPSGNSMECK